MLQHETFSEPIAHTKLARILRSISRLRPLPTNVSRILRALDDPRTTALRIAELLSLDQALTAYMIRVANSAYLGYTLPCSSLSEAVMRLGFKRIRELVLSTAVSGPLTRSLNGYRFGDGALWNHSVAVASIAHWFARAISYTDPVEAYVAGLLHDMGKLILDQYVQADYRQIVEIMGKQNLHLWQVEKLLFGIDHAAVGGLMSSEWQFPISLIEAIHYHHAPFQAKNYPQLVSLVNIANALSPEDEIALTDLGGRSIHPKALHLLHMDEQMLNKMKVAMHKDFDEYEQRRPLAIYRNDL